MYHRAPQSTENRAQMTGGGFENEASFCLVGCAVDHRQMVQNPTVLREMFLELLHSTRQQTSRPFVSKGRRASLGMCSDVAM